MSKEPISIVNTGEKIDKSAAQDIAREIMKDIENTKAKIAADKSSDTK